MNTTISFQADTETKAVLDELARTEGISRSDVLRRMLMWQRFLLGVTQLERDLQPTISKNRLVSDDDFENYLG